MILESDSPWSFPLILAVKPEGGTRVCVDCRAPNHVTRNDAHPLPRINASLLRFSDVKYFSHIDLRLGYQQIILDLASRQTAAFRRFMVTIRDLNPPITRSFWTLRLIPSDPKIKAIRIGPIPKKYGVRSSIPADSCRLVLFVALNFD